MRLPNRFQSLSIPLFVTQTILVGFIAIFLHDFAGPVRMEAGNMRGGCARNRFGPGSSGAASGKCPRAGKRDHHCQSDCCELHGLLKAMKLTAIGLAMVIAL